MKALTAAQKQQFEEEGYLVVPDFLKPATDLQPVLDEFDEILDRLAHQLKAEGAIRSTYRDLPFNKRITQISIETGGNYIQHFDFSLPHRGITHDTPVNTGQAIFNLITHPRLLDVVEDLIGPEIFSNPVQHVRMKVPAPALPKDGYSYLAHRVPWHQDNGVVMPDADESTILTVWFPLTAATIENGCMQVVPRSHRRGIIQHCNTVRGIEIPDSTVNPDEVMTLPMSAGSLLLLTQRTMHSSLENKTDDEVRISMDLRYQPIGQPTGREAFAPAGFIARSAAHPESVLRDRAGWTRRWDDLREALIGDDRQYYRWAKDAVGCA